MDWGTWLLTRSEVPFGRLPTPNTTNRKAYLKEVKKTPRKKTPEPVWFNHICLTSLWIQIKSYLYTSFCLVRGHHGQHYTHYTLYIMKYTTLCLVRGYHGQRSGRLPWHPIGNNHLCKRLGLQNWFMEVGKMNRLKIETCLTTIGWWVLLVGTTGLLDLSSLRLGVANYKRVLF